MATIKAEKKKLKLAAERETVLENGDAAGSSTVEPAVSEVGGTIKNVCMCVLLPLMDIHLFEFLANHL